MEVLVAQGRGAVFSSDLRREVGPGAGELSLLQRPMELPDSSFQVLLHSERAHGTHQIVCPPQVCNGLTQCPPHRSTNQWLSAGL